MLSSSALELNYNESTQHFIIIHKKTACAVVLILMEIIIEFEHCQTKARAAINIIQLVRARNVPYLLIKLGKRERCFTALESVVLMLFLSKLKFHLVPK